MRESAIAGYLLRQLRGRDLSTALKAVSAPKSGDSQAKRPRSGGREPRGGR